jgi:hypothetical protein
MTTEKCYGRWQIMVPQRCGREVMQVLGLYGVRPRVEFAEVVGYVDNS